MIVSHHGRTIELLGDPHLGRKFIHGVPLHRRGEREAMVWQDFETSLAETSADLHVDLGDLFNAAIVPYDVILRAARAYVQAAQDHPRTQFLILQGNHDVSRDLERISAFDVFAEIVWGVANVQVVREPVLVDGLLLVPFDPVTPTAELIAELAPIADVAFGHWDTESFGDDHNLIPTKLLAEAHSYEQHKARFDTLACEIEHMRATAENWRKAREAMTVLRSLVKRHLVPSLNRVASHLVAGMTGGQRNAIVVDQEFNVTVDAQPLDTLSGSAKAVANLALRIGLGQGLTSKMLSLFIGDEIDASLDQNRAENTSSTLRYLADRISQILLVTHKSPDADYHIRLAA